MRSRINNPEVCIVCARRADGLAVGHPRRLGWFCNECGPVLAKKALHMTEHRKFDPFEERAAASVAALVGTSTITLSQEELAEFITWAVKEFGEALAKEIDAGWPPF